MKTGARCFKRLMFLVGLLCLTLPASGDEVTVGIDGRGEGRIFEGVGAVSAGASTRLLYDYRQPHRGHVLDFLFKPKFGAAFQRLKVEIGGGENSTCGSEPSHVISRQELSNPQGRGYEFWLMKEAKTRNPDIILNCLPWCFPGWMSGKFTQDSADWFVAFLDVAKKQYGIGLNYVSAAENENGTDRDWIVNILRPALDAAGYGDVKIQAPDDDSDVWKIFEQFENDPNYEQAVDAVGYHYINGREPWEIDMVSGRDTTSLAKKSGKPLWASEEWSTGGGQWDGVGAMFVARLINKLYVRDRITSVQIWCPIDSIYAGLLWSDSGAMQADSPWSGHYTVWPVVWAVAHTTQFTRPGWRYLDEACGRFDSSTWKGTYVTLRNPATGDWSMVVCTDGRMSLKVDISGGLKAAPVHLWKSDAKRQFERIDSIKPREGSFTVKLAGNSIYTLTTTTGQEKGSHPVPSEGPFPFPYDDDFENYAVGAMARYFSDQKGSFEVCSRPDGGKCLGQIAREEGYEWVYVQDLIKPHTVIGDHRWRDYAVSADVYITGGDVEVGGRFSDRVNLSYRWILDRDGRWKLNHQADTLARGTLNEFDPSVWHNLKLVLAGDTLQGFIDDRLLAEVTDSSASQGMAYLATTYDRNLFDNVSICEPE